MVINGSHLNSTSPDPSDTVLNRPPWVTTTLGCFLIFTIVVDILGNLLVIFSVYRNKKLRNAGEWNSEKCAWRLSGARVIKLGCVKKSKQKLCHVVKVTASLISCSNTLLWITTRFQVDILCFLYVVSLGISDKNNIYIYIIFFNVCLSGELSISNPSQHEDTVSAHDLIQPITQSPIREYVVFIVSLLLSFLVSQQGLIIYLFWYLI